MTSGLSWPTDVEDEVLQKYQKKKTSVGAKTKAGGGLRVGTQKVGQEERKAKGQEGKSCLVAFVTEFNRICKQIVSEGKNPAHDGVRSSLFFDMV